MNARSETLVVPDLCNVPAISLVVLFGQLLVLVLLFAGGEPTWLRLALLSLYVQWVALVSAGALCVARDHLARIGLVWGSVAAFAIVMVVTLVVGIRRLAPRAARAQ